MFHDRHTILVESIKRLLRRNALPHLKKIVRKTHAADLADVFRQIGLAEQKRLFSLMNDVEQQGLLLSELEESIFLEFIREMSVDDIVRILDEMPNDDVADLIGLMPPETGTAVLEKMEKEGSEEVEGLLRYSDDTAGGIMTPDFVALSQDDTAKEAIESLQKEHRDVEMPFYLYVVDDLKRLVGVISLRQLVVVKPETRLRDIMNPELVSVQTSMDQEEVAKIVARYDILAVPVVDETGVLEGIVTVDDVIDIFRMEATEDILKMAGVGEMFVETQTILGGIRIRLPWLFASCLGGILAFYVISGFEDTLAKYAYLAAFMPVIAGMGGNVGTQSSTIVVRGLATGRLSLGDFWKVIGKELLVGLFLGIVYGTLIGLVAELQYSIFMLNIVVALAMISSMTIAASMGALVPMGLARMKIDPAVATGPFVTTSTDVITAFLYFTIATKLLNM
ncbi:magnesium transporter [Desulfobotulus alkaliphilus]|uniref:Magnesium transporter MgtE n=1 Tax=Desulfobotulus alkaliphilus TaxID=622671 RepID=A0A562S142_9BACT|nr:magnesium transporter [Desulfobotulus alkaliphilus]TWI74380.1 magnesium transporter [Desulfobotulus alkaliphilus]